jgi:hypothetical protein
MISGQSASLQHFYHSCCCGSSEDRRQQWQQQQQQQQRRQQWWWQWQQLPGNDSNSQDLYERSFESRHEPPARYFYIP